MKQKGRATPKLSAKGGFAPILVLILIVAAVGVGAFYLGQTRPKQTINSFGECAKAGYPVIVLQTYPPQKVCKTADGKTFKKVVEEKEIATREECEEFGGKWNAWGLLGREFCQIPLPDAGKACWDGSECSARECLTTEGNVPGKCPTFQATFGCFGFVKDGKVSPTLCRD